jgi:hypothetical protein
MADREDEIEATARKLAEDKARLDELGVLTDDLEEEVEQPSRWKGNVA